LQFVNGGTANKTVPYYEHNIYFYIVIFSHLMLTA